MFEEFLYTLRRGGLKVSLTEWMSLMEALDKGLHRSSFTGFYYLCRCLLVKSEADFDRFDRCFLQYFRDVPFEGEVSQELLDWLDRPDVLSGYANWDEEQARLNELLSEEEIEKMLQERMREQNEEHNGGNYWVGTHGMSTFGNSGLSPKGIRVGGQGMHRRAFRVAGERKFRDFRKDNTLDTRQFQVALKRLRQYSGLVELPPPAEHGEGAAAHGLGRVHGLLRPAVLRPVPGGEQGGPLQGSEGLLLPQLRLRPGVRQPQPAPQRSTPDRLAAVQPVLGVQGDLCGGRPDGPL